jgi:hypothetical protein
VQVYLELDLCAIRYGRMAGEETRCAKGKILGIVWIGTYNALQTASW